MGKFCNLKDLSPGALGEKVHNISKGIVNQPFNYAEHLAILKFDRTNLRKKGVVTF